MRAQAVESVDIPVAHNVEEEATAVEWEASPAMCRRQRDDGGRRRRGAGCCPESVGRRGEAGECDELREYESPLSPI